MDYLIKGILTILLNALVFFGLQFIVEFVYLLTLDSETPRVKYSTIISLFFVVAQIAAVVIIYWRKRTLEDLYVVLLSIIVVLVLYFGEVGSLENMILD